MAKRSRAASVTFVRSPGILIAVVVTAANVDDARAGPGRLRAGAQVSDFPRLQVVFADGKYHNHELYDWLCRHKRPYRTEIVSRPKGEKKFKPLPGALGRGKGPRRGEGSHPVLEQGLRAHAGGE